MNELCDLKIKEREFIMKKMTTKKIVLLIIIMSVLTLLVVKGIKIIIPPKGANGYKEYKSVTYFDHDTIEYGDKKYSEKKSELNDIIKGNVDNLSLISWHHSFHLSKEVSYSHSTKNPDYIVYCGTVYYKESFDSSNIVFVGKDSKLEVAYSDTFTYKGDFADREKYDYYTSYTVNVKSHPELEVTLNFFVNGDGEYMYTMGNGKTATMHSVSNTFLNMLINNGIIEVHPFDGDINDFIISDGVSSYFREGGPKIMKVFYLKKNEKVIDVLCIVEYERNYDLLSLVSPDGGKSLILMTLKDHVWVNKEYFITNKAMGYQLQFQFSNKELEEWDYADIMECQYKGETYWFGVDYVKIIRAGS